MICAVTSLVLNYLWSFLAAQYPNYFSLFCRRPGILVLINEADWELMVCTPSVWLSLLKILLSLFCGCSQRSYFWFLPQAKHLIFEGEGAGWNLSPVLWLFKSLEPLSNLLSLISQTGSEERSPFFPDLWNWVLHLQLLAGPPTCGVTAWGAPGTFRPHTELTSLKSGGA